MQHNRSEWSFTLPLHLSALPFTACKGCTPSHRQRRAVPPLRHLLDPAQRIGPCWWWMQRRSWPCRGAHPPCESQLLAPGCPRVRQLYVYTSALPMESVRMQGHGLAAIRQHMIRTLTAQIAAYSRRYSHHRRPAGSVGCSHGCGHGDRFALQGALHHHARGRHCDVQRGHPGQQLRRQPRQRRSARQRSRKGQRHLHRTHSPPLPRPT